MAVPYWFRRAIAVKPYLLRAAYNKINLVPAVAVDIENDDTVTKTTAKNAKEVAIL